MASNRTERWLAQRADKIIASMWTTEYQGIVAAIDRLASDETKRSQSEDEAIDYQRVIADLRVLAAHKKMRPLAEGEAVYSDRVRLGFSTIVDEVTAASAHARYCRQSGNLEMAAGYASAALKTIELNRRTARPPVPPELEVVLREVTEDHNDH